LDTTINVLSESMKNLVGLTILRWEIASSRRENIVFVY